MKETLWGVGGEQRISFYKLEEWSLYKTALAVRVEDGRATRALEYESPPEHCPTSCRPTSQHPPGLTVWFLQPSARDAIHRQ